MTEARSEPRALNTLLIGGGAREHALARGLAASRHIARLHVTHPMNPGLAALGTAIDVPIDRSQLYRLEQYCNQHSIGLVVIGPEAPLADGFGDALRTETRLVFGPDSDGARLEADKAWAKQLMRSASIPTAEGRTFTNAESAIHFLESRDEPHVVKATGLASGKGVLVPRSLDEATAFVTSCMVDRRFGDAGSTVLIEELLEGPEVSLFALVDGRSIYVMESAQDYKRLGDDDDGPNTGGMGAVSPSRRMTEHDLERIEREILVPTVDALKREGISYRGVLYAGLMLTPAGPKVIEFNVRFGDPECQAILARLESDLGEAVIATCTGRLAETTIAVSPKPSCCVVLASEGYPDDPRTGRKITGIDLAESQPGVSVMHGGVRRDDNGDLLTDGGRVLSVVATGDTADDARERAYAAARSIQFDGMQMRTDIGFLSAARS
ncbi:MAG: phosphoribosylamine--glycine ligase [Planctomycetota bacterium]